MLYLENNLLFIYKLMSRSLYLLIPLTYFAFPQLLA